MIRCRVCQSEKLRHIGALPNVAFFAGRKVDALPKSTLFRCEVCTFLFRAPILSAIEYEHLYQSGSAEVWESREPREDFRRVRNELIAHKSIRDVLDIGCYSGKLLNSLPDGFRLFGIEPNTDAARVARSRGVDVIAETVEQLASTNRQFDAIIACDVIEHLPDPLTFLLQLRTRLRVGGLLLLTTGDADAWLWRIAGARFWYCYFPEHISFVGSRWLNNPPAQTGMTVSKLERFNYRSNMLLTKRILTTLAAVSYALSPRFFQLVKARLFKFGGPLFGPPGCGATRDHLFCVLTAV